MVFRSILCPLCRCSNNISMSFRKQSLATKKEVKNPGPKPTVDKSSPDVLNFLESSEYDDIRHHLPKSLLRKYKSPESMYLINKTTARHIVGTIGSRLHDKSPLVEVSPGPGVLTKQLLISQKKDIHLYESSAHFAQSLKELQDNYPNRVHYKMADFFGMWKLAFQDKMDNGSRMKDLLGDMVKEKSSMKIFGVMPSLNFVKHLIFTILFHNDNDLLGRPDLFIAMSSFNYAYLKNDGTTLQKKAYRSTPALFQILFDYKVLSKVPRSHFLPWQFQTQSKKGPLPDEDYMYIVNITQKEQLPCSAESLPLMWYFFKPHMLSRSTRVIPSLEQWIPGCGVWLISGQDPPDTNRALAPGPNDAPLPHMTIFTQFGDLTIPQKLTIFKRFISWPEFEQCPFRATMETNLPKSIVASDLDDKETHASVTSIEDDVGDSDSEEDKHE